MSNWTKRFLNLALEISTWSKDPSTKVGCVIVGSDNEILSVGFNGVPKKVFDLPDRYDRPAKYSWVSHAEENAIAQAAKKGIALEKSTLYCTHQPCSKCARTIIQSGINRVVFLNGVTAMPAEEFEISKTMFDEAMVELAFVEQLNFKE
jgi:dCMP deaminase